MQNIAKLDEETTMEKAFTNFVNASGATEMIDSELLARYCDSLLSKNVKTKDEDGILIVQEFSLLNNFVILNNIIFNNNLLKILPKVK